MAKPLQPININKRAECDSLSRNYVRCLSNEGRWPFDAFCIPLAGSKHPLDYGYVFSRKGCTEATDSFKKSSVQNLERGFVLTADRSGCGLSGESIFIVAVPRGEFFKHDHKPCGEHVDGVDVEIFFRGGIEKDIEIGFEAIVRFPIADQNRDLGQWM